MTAIEVCRTAALGRHLERCDCCNRERPCYDSCGDRHCPKCQSLARAEWVEKRASEVLLALFSCRLPKRSLPSLARTRISSTAFSSEPLPRPCPPSLPIPNIWAPRSAFFAILRRWGQNLFFHPHLHCDVPGGGFHLLVPGESPPASTFITGQGALSALPPIVLTVPAGGLRRRQVAVLLFASGTPRSRSRGYHPLSRSSTKRGMVVYAKHPSPGHTKWWTKSTATRTG